MSTFTITVIGAGVIGASMGLAFKQEKEPLRLIVHDKELSQAQAAVKRGAFDKAEWNLINACEPADLIILALPLSAIRPTLEAIAPYLKPGVVITDTARLKASVLTWANELLPAHVHFIGGDPLVYAPGIGLEHATKELFRQRLYCLTPAPQADESAVQSMVGIVSLLGAKPFFLDAVEHDGLVAAVDTLPTLVSAALLETVVGQSSWRELRKLAGRAFEQVSAGASGDPDSLRDSLLANKEVLLHWLDSYLGQLQQFRALLVEANAAEALAQKLDHAVVERHNWLVDYHRGSFDDPDLALPPLEKRGLMQQLVGLGGLGKRQGNQEKQGSKEAGEQGSKK
jgi:prephenate dehydrogenase